MTRRPDRSRRSTVQVTRRVACGGIAALALCTLLPTDARAAGPTPESVARETLMDALAPALAVRGATAVVTVAPLDARRTLEPCNQMQGFMPPGSRLAGKTAVGIRCVDGASWQTFLSAHIRVDASTWQATRALRAGETIATGDVVRAVSSLTAPDLDAAGALARSGARTAPASRGLVSIDGREPAPIGRVVLRSVAAGRALTASDVRDEGRINPGDPVRVVYVGDGFSVSSEGRSVGAADPGGNVMIRLASGSVVSGTLRADHLVELPR